MDVTAVARTLRESEDNLRRESGATFVEGGSRRQCEHCCSHCRYRLHSVSVSVHQDAMDQLPRWFDLCVAFHLAPPSLRSCL